MPLVPLKNTNAPQPSCALHCSQQSEKLDGTTGEGDTGPYQMLGMGSLHRLLGTADTKSDMGRAIGRLALRKKVDILPAGCIPPHKAGQSGQAKATTAHLGAVEAQHGLEAAAMPRRPGAVGAMP